MVNKKKKKKKHTKKIVGGGCIVAALIAGGMFLDLGALGLGEGTGGLPALPVFGEVETVDNPNVADDPAEETAPPSGTDEVAAEPEPLSLVIRVSGDSIIHGEEPLASIDELRARLLEFNQPDYLWTIRDERAILATLNEVQMLFDEIDVRYEMTRE
jgi:hypothetical protein